LFQAGFGHAETSLAVDVVLHVGTLLAMILYFRKDLVSLARSLVNRTAGPERREMGLILAATAVTAAVGFGLKGTVEQLSASLGAAGIGFLLTAGFLLWGESRSRRRTGDLTVASRAPVWQALLIGLVQGAAVWPGLSRSASTIAVALAFGWKWEEAGRFSFLAAIPAICGATLLMARDVQALPVGPSVVGCVVSFLTGMVALRLLMGFLRARRLWPFALYTFALGLYALLKASRSV
jgi:undecaprenyl-diphosphatase